MLLNNLEEVTGAVYSPTLIEFCNFWFSFACMLLGQEYV
jgi:hypothetical protein